MGIYEKSALLSLLRLRLEKDRDQDWQTLQQRDRSWFLEQGRVSRWPLVRQWLSEFSPHAAGGVGLLSLALSFVGFAAGFFLIAGLLEFKSFERINVLWFLLLAIGLPLLFWVFGLVLARSEGGFPVLAVMEHRAPGWMQNRTLFPLLRQTAVVLSQQVSMLFATGMLMAFLLYLLVTDLAFGWSSTIDIGADSLHGLTSVLSWPWRTLWPEAVPSFALVEQTRFYRAAPATVDMPVHLGHWWRFLLMCLFVYVWLPRVVSFVWFRWRLSRMQNNNFESDALIAGWWQRLEKDAVRHQAEDVTQSGLTAESSDAVQRLPICEHVVLWGMWPEEQWFPVKETLNKKIPDFQLYKIKDKQWLAETTRNILETPENSVLIICKGWEPPTGELADFCTAIAVGKSNRYLWPVPLSGLPAERIADFNRSWRAFVPTLPDGFNLYLGDPDA